MNEGVGIGVQWQVRGVDNLTCRDWTSSDDQLQRFDREQHEVDLGALDGIFARHGEIAEMTRIRRSHGVTICVLEMAL